MNLQVGESAREDVAHVDESGVRLSDGARLVGLVAVLTRSSARLDIAGPLRDLVLPGRNFLHYYDETPTPPDSGRRYRRDPPDQRRTHHYQDLTSSRNALMRGCSRLCCPDCSTSSTSVE